MLHAGDHANGRRTEELVRRATNGREGSGLSTVAFHHGLSFLLWQKAPGSIISSLESDI